MPTVRKEWVLEDFKTKYIPEKLQHLINEHTITYSFSKLREREVLVICHRYQIDGKEFLTLEELAKKLERTRELIRGVEVKAAKKIVFFFEQYQRKKFYESKVD